jgi:hypothetical protein
VWARDLRTGNFEQTVLTGLGAGNGWLAVAPVLAALASAVALTARATPRLRIGVLRPVVWALSVWSVVCVVGPSIAGDHHPPLGSGWEALELVALAMAASALTLSLLRYRERVEELVPRRLGVEPALGDRSA